MKKTVKQIRKELKENKFIHHPLPYEVIDYERNIFIPFDPELAERITKIGNDYLRDLKEQRIRFLLDSEYYKLDFTNSQKKVPRKDRINNLLSAEDDE